MDIVQLLRQRLQLPLPGALAHRVFVPNIPNANIRLAPPPASARASAVVVPIVNESEPTLLLTVRTEHLRSHAGQISFPGGRLDEGEDVIQGALRELNEEIGITADSVEILGTLSSLYIPPSNSSVTPVVGIVRGGSPRVESTEEVAEILRVPLASLLSPTVVQHHTREMYGKSVDVPHFAVHPTIPLWGATAMIINELVMILNAP